MKTNQIPNFDPVTQCHYGVINQNSIHPEAMDDIYSNSRDLTYESAVEEIKAKIKGIESVADLDDILKDIGAHYFDGDKRCLLAQAVWDECELVANSEQTDEAIEAVWNEIEQNFNDHYCWDDHSWLYESDGYKLTNCLDYDVFVLTSPYFTYARPCSPCVPNAGDLDSACEENADCFNPCGIGIGEKSFKTFCLGHEWFENDCAPYAVYSVETGEIIASEKEETI